MSCKTEYASEGTVRQPFAFVDVEGGYVHQFGGGVSASVTTAGGTVVSGSSPGLNSATIVGKVGCTIPVHEHWQSSAYLKYYGITGGTVTKGSTFTVGALTVEATTTQTVDWTNMGLVGISGSYANPSWEDLSVGGYLAAGAAYFSGTVKSDLLVGADAVSLDQKDYDNGGIAVNVGLTGEYKSANFNVGYIGVLPEYSLSSNTDTVSGAVVKYTLNVLNYFTATVGLKFTFYPFEERF